MLNEVLETVADGGSLSRQEMAEAIGAMVDAGCPPAQIAGLLMALRVKGESVDEVAGAADAFRDRAIPIPLAERPMLCTAGTGGDRQGTLNLSTAAALVAAAAGVTVAKHGNRSVSSQCGSADLLEEMGVPVELTPEQAARSVETHNFAFLFAPQFHPAMKAVAPVRRELGVRTLFNMLGPLTNPARARTQLAGVYSPARAELMARALAAAGVERAIVVSAEVGLDEISPEGVTHIVDAKDGEITQYDVTAEMFGLKPAPLASIKGGAPRHNARKIEAVLSGEKTPARTGVLLNASAALVAAGLAGTFEAGAALAAETIERGRVRDLLDGLRKTVPLMAASA